MALAGLALGFTPVSPALAQSASAPSISMPTRLGDWRRAETEHFILYSDGSEKALREDAIKLERFDRLMRLVTKVSDDQSQVKLSVYFVGNEDKVQSLYPGPVKGVSGFYSTNPAGVLAVVPRTATSYGEDSRKFADLEDVILFHEYAHHLMKQYFAAAYPAWYVEGFAEFIGNSRVESDGIIKYGIPNISRAPSLFQSVQLPIEKLLTARVTDLKGEQLGNLYARGWVLTHYLNFEPSRKGQLARYLTAIGTGKPSLEAAREVFGDLKQLNRALDRYVTGSIAYTKIAAPFPEPKPFAVTQLSQAQSDIVLLRIKLARGTVPKEREPIAKELRRLASLYPGNAEVATSLSEAELDLGNEAASGVAADAALKIDPQNSRALLWKGLSMARPLVRAKDHDPAKWKVARAWIVKANRANPEDPLALYEYFVSYVQPGLPISDVTVSAVAKAVSLVPQESILRFAYAYALGGQKKYDEAIAALGPVVNDPHGGSEATAAQKMIDLITQAKASGSVPQFGMNALSGGEEEK